MSDPADTNASIWKSDATVDVWVSGAAERERTRLEQWRLMGQLLPFAPDNHFTFLDLGAGTGAAAKVILGLYPRSHAVLADYSPQMIEQGERALADFGDRFRYVRFDLLEQAWPATIPVPLDAVITSLCVHHLPDSRKQTLFADILARLAPGGWYLNYDPVLPPDPVVGVAWERADDRRDPGAAHKRHNRNAPEQAQWENHIRHIVPLERQVGFLRAAGFEAVDVYWKQLDHVIYGGRRPLPPV
jgi:SAM-dependent methyltransferase